MEARAGRPGRRGRRSRGRRGRRGQDRWGGRKGGSGVEIREQAHHRKVIRSYFLEDSGCVCKREVPRVEDIVEEMARGRGKLVLLRDTSEETLVRRKKGSEVEILEHSGVEEEVAAMKIKIPPTIRREYGEGRWERISCVRGIKSGEGFGFDGESCGTYVDTRVNLPRVAMSRVWVG